jgi:hypothetical protein
MRLTELELSSAVQFHDELNPAIWRGNQLRPEVKQKLLDIAQDFKEFIGIDLYDLVDITISGSNAAYTYTPNSDIDLHLVVIIPDAHDPELRQLFDAKKYQYNDQFDFMIRGFDVELYVQDAEQPHHSMGIYSLLQDRWLRQPQKIKATVDDSSVKHKYRAYKSRIKQALADNDGDRIKKLWNSIKDMRKSGLARGGEFSVENLVFKLLRAEGDLGDLKDAMTNIKTKSFSLEQA